MENAADALQMAAAVLVFVLALSISINAFGEARQTAQTILDNRDREYDYEYIQGDTTERIVKGETIIPSIYKAYKENYKIVFTKNNGEGIKLYQKFVATNSTDKKPICYIDLENEVLGSDKQKEEFLQILLYGREPGQDIKIFTDTGLTDLPVKGNTGDYQPLYDRIKNHTYEEKLGVYYQEELQGTSNAPDANKTEKRVLTYIEQ